ncbi:hypothetical protein [Methylococcus sp. EFPC2]|uniref:hypothetical protein n=1 Tax=Methylococcus sp. EFPC2 TaxID=2812648 RepID=UPI00196826C5|nr:hypothetical protein [Methylococcus sp. EFPC2]QSA98389.1 hypothetical protein JWZ97_06165 [Methylococcus sp. EFPC2]
MHALRELERVEWRVLGALRFVDATTRAPVEGPLVLQAEGAVLTRNRSGLYVIRHWDALSAHEAEFSAPPADPAPASRVLSVAVNDPSGRYLPVIAAVPLPRSPAPALAADSLFQAQQVPLYPSPSASVGSNWAVLRISLSETASGDALGGALLRVRSNGSVLARGLTDWRGEALVPVAGVPVTTFSDNPDAVLISEIEVRLQALFDPATGSRTPMAQVRAGRAPQRLPSVDPAALEDAAAALPQTERNLAIAARRAQSLSMNLSLP